jgi:hypothetical protein
VYYTDVNVSRFARRAAGCCKKTETEGMKTSNLKIVGGTETIFVAEDNVELANLVKAVLADNG